MEKNYVIDTNVLLDNPDAISILRNGTENNIYIPKHVLFELDKLKKEPKLKPQVRRAVKKIIEEEEHIFFIDNDESVSRFTETTDIKILREIQREIKNSNIESPIFITNDKILSLLSKNLGIVTEEFKSSNPYTSESQLYTGFSDSSSEIINSFYWSETGKPVFNGFREKQTITETFDIWGIRPKNIYQNLAFFLLLNPDLHLVTIQSDAGHGKTLLSLAAAFDLVFQKKLYKKIYIVKSATELGEKLGFRPGDMDEKFAPVVRPVINLVEKLNDIRPVSKIFSRESTESKIVFNKRRFEILPLNFIQGMNIEDSIIIIDEAQNLTRMEMRTILTRCCDNVKVFAIGDTNQVIPSYLNKSNNGINWVTKKFKGQRNYGHIVLKGSKSRGPITDMVLKTGF